MDFLKSLQIELIAEWQIKWNNRVSKDIYIFPTLIRFFRIRVMSLNLKSPTEFNFIKLVRH